MNKNNISKVSKLYKLSKYNKDILKYIVYSIICILVLILFFKYIFIEKFEINTILNTNIINNTNTINNSNKIYVICRKREYNYLEDYILSFYKKLNAEIIIFNDIKDIPKINKTDIFIFLQILIDEILNSIDSQNSNIYLINTEQLSYNEHKQRINSYPKNIKMLDYSKANMSYYDGYYTKYLSYQVNYDEIYNLPKTKDICIILGSSGDIPTKRKYIIDLIKSKGYEIDFISGWNKERDEKLFTYKILVNISYQDDYKIFEALRCDRCIFNKMIVISDKKKDMDLYNLKDYMIFEDYDKVADKVVEVLNNYDTYYKKLGLDTLNLETLQIEPVSL